MEQTIILEILEAYKTKESVKSICRRFAISTNTLSKYVDEANIPKRAKKQQIKKDLSKFKDLDNPELQYWIGYICADGSIQYSLKHRVYKVSLFSKLTNSLNRSVVALEPGIIMTGDIWDFLLSAKS